MNMRDYSSLYMDGRWQKPTSSDVFEVISPGSQERTGSVSGASTADIDTAVAAARRAFDNGDWTG